MSTTITLEELLAEFERLGINAEPNDEGHTSKEYCEQWGVGIEKCRVLLGKLRDAGALEMGHRTITNLNGVNTRVPVYRIVEVKKKRGKA